MSNNYDWVSFQMGVAGLGLGAFSGLLDTLSACSRLYRMWRSVRDLDGYLGLLRTKLVLQHALLQEWERDWLTPPSGSKASISPAKHQWLKQHEAAVTETLDTVRRILESLEPLREATESNKDAGGVASVINRLQWVNDKAQESERSLEHLDSLLAGLYRLLPPTIRNAQVSRAILTMEDLLPDDGGKLPASIDTMLDEAEDLQNEDITAFNDTFHLRRLGHELNEDLKDRIARFVSRPPPSENLVVKSTRIRRTSIDHSAAGLRGYGLLDGDQPVLIEWKKYDASWVGQKGIDLLGRIRNIAHLLNTNTKPKELLTLKCLGFYDDTERISFGFIFQLPTITNPTSGLALKHEMVSLKSLLDQPSPETLPTLNERYEVAYNLSFSLSILHAVCWLHKSIRSHNVLFPVLPDGRPVWSQPYLVGFDFSREDAIDESSEKPEQSTRFNVYRHPSAQGSPGQGYHRAFDIYSLGVVLVELALWRLAWRLYKDGLTAEDFRNVVVKKCKDWVAHLMGAEYREVALKCLDGSFEEQMQDAIQRLHIEVTESLGRLQ